eukprot:485223-Pelagomonas_calceolata.AAC.1
MAKMSPEEAEKGMRWLAERLGCGCGVDMQSSWFAKLLPSADGSISVKEHFVRSFVVSVHECLRARAPKYLFQGVQMHMEQVVVSASSVKGAIAHGAGVGRCECAWSRRWEHILQFLSRVHVHVERVDASASSASSVKGANAHGAGRCKYIYVRAPCVSIEGGCKCIQSEGRKRIWSRCLEAHHPFQVFMSASIQGVRSVRGALCCLSHAICLCILSGAASDCWLSVQCIQERPEHRPSGSEYLNMCAGTHMQGMRSAQHASITKDEEDAAASAILCVQGLTSAFAGMGQTL